MERSQPEKPKNLTLKDIPADVYQLLLKMQYEKKAACNCQYSLQAIIYSLVRREGKDVNTNTEL